MKRVNVGGSWYNTIFRNYAKENPRKKEVLEKI